MPKTCGAVTIEREYPKDERVSEQTEGNNDMLRPLGKNVAVALIEEKQKMEGNFYIPEIASGVKKGVVKFVGPKVSDVIEGETVVLPKGDLMEVNYKDNKYIIIHEEHIVAAI